MGPFPRCLSMGISIHLLASTSSTSVSRYCDDMKYAYPLKSSLSAISDLFFCQFPHKIPSSGSGFVKEFLTTRLTYRCRHFVSMQTPPGAEQRLPKDGTLLSSLEAMDLEEALLRQDRMLRDTLRLKWCRIYDPSSNNMVCMQSYLCTMQEAMPPLK